MHFRATFESNWAKIYTESNAEARQSYRITRVDIRAGCNQLFDHADIDVLIFHLNARHHQRSQTRMGLLRTSKIYLSTCNETLCQKLERINELWCNIRYLKYMAVKCAKISKILQYNVVSLKRKASAHGQQHQNHHWDHREIRFRPTVHWCLLLRSEGVAHTATSYFSTTCTQDA